MAVSLKCHCRDSIVAPKTAEPRSRACCGSLLVPQRSSVGLLHLRFAGPRGHVPARPSEGPVSRINQHNAQFFSHIPPRFT